MRAGSGALLVGVGLLILWVIVSGHAGNAVNAWGALVGGDAPPSPPRGPAFPRVNPAPVRPDDTRVRPSDFFTLPALQPLPSLVTA